MPVAAELGERLGIGDAELAVIRTEGIAGVAVAAAIGDFRRHGYGRQGVDLVVGRRAGEIAEHNVVFEGVFDAPLVQALQLLVLRLEQDRLRTVIAQIGLGGRAGDGAHVLVLDVVVGLDAVRIALLHHQHRAVPPCRTAEGDDLHALGIDVDVGADDVRALGEERGDLGFPRQPLELDDLDAEPIGGRLVDLHVDARRLVRLRVDEGMRRDVGDADGDAVLHCPIVGAVGAVFEQRFRLLVEVVGPHRSRKQRRAGNDAGERDKNHLHLDSSRFRFFVPPSAPRGPRRDKLYTRRAR